MQLKDLVKPISQQTDEELQERLRQIRHNREIARPAAKKFVEKSEKKASAKKVDKLSTQLGLLSDAEKEALIKQLSEES